MYSMRVWHSKYWVDGTAPRLVSDSSLLLIWIDSLIHILGRLSSLFSCLAPSQFDHVVSNMALPVVANPCYIELYMILFTNWSCITFSCNTDYFCVRYFYNIFFCLFYQYIPAHNRYKGFCILLKKLLLRICELLNELQLIAKYDWGCDRCDVT